MSVDTAGSKTLLPIIGQDEPATGTRANAAVITAIRAHHAQLSDALRTKTAALLRAAESGSWNEQLGDLHAWYRDELIPHAVAEEKTLYSLAGDLDATALLIRGMLDEHRALVALVADLALTRDGFHAALLAASAQTLFASHLSKENDLLLPALDTAGVDLDAVLHGMHEILGGHAHAEADAGCGCGCGCGHDGAVGEPAAVDVADDELDVRTLPHGARHEIIFAKLDALQPGEALVIVNDHDPKPLRYQTAALWPDRFEWTYRESGPVVWRVAITRAG